MPNLITFHHIGVAVREFEKSVKHYTRMGFSCTAPIKDPLQEVELIFCTKNGFPSVELIKPINEKSPVNTYLKEKSEEIYHLCYETADIGQALKLLFGEERYLCVSKPKPAVLFGGREVSFYYSGGIGLIELLT